MSVKKVTKGKNTLRMLEEILGMSCFVSSVVSMVNDGAKILILSSAAVRERGSTLWRLMQDAEYLSLPSPQAFLSFLGQAREWKYTLGLSEDGVEAALSKREMTLCMQAWFSCLPIVPPTLLCSRRVILVRNIISKVKGQLNDYEGRWCNIPSSKQ